VPDEPNEAMVEPIESGVALELLGLRWRTGRLQTLVDGESFGLFVDAGRVIFATSSQRTLRLGHLLLQRGVVGPVELHHLLRAERDVVRTRPLGSSLVAGGSLSRADLAAGVEEQAVEILARILDQTAATHLFVYEEPLPAGIEIVPLDTDHLLARAEQRRSERMWWRAMQRLLPGPDQPLRFTATLPLVSFDLTDAELLVALTVDRGGATLERLALDLPLDPLTLRRTVIALLERGYLAPGDAPPFGPLT
jgi:hypothetical protein